MYMCVLHNKINMHVNIIYCIIYIYLILLCKNRDDINDIVIPCTSFIGDTNVVLPKEILLLKKIIIATLTTSIRYILFEILFHLFIKF